jgi:hypothetical protein
VSMSPPAILQKPTLLLGKLYRHKLREGA